MTERLNSSREQRVRQGQGLVRMIALRLHRKFGERFELDDLIAYGQVGLVQAAERFDPGAGNQFTTFAYYRIRGAIYDGISRMGGQTRAMFRRTTREEHFHDLLEQASEPDPFVDAETESSDQVRWLARATAQGVALSLVSLDAALGDEADIAGRALPPEQEALLSEVRSRIRELIARLPAEPRELIRLLYYEGESLQEAARRIGISKSWASRVHARTLQELALQLEPER